MDAWSGPAARDFFADIYDVLHNCQEHCGVVIPERWQRSFRAALLRSSQEGYGEIHIITLEPSNRLLADLAGEFCETGKKPTSVKELARRHLNEGQILALNFPNDIASWRKEYYEFLAWISADAKRRKDSGEPLNWSLLCILPPGSGFKADSGMRILEWWGRHYPSDLEFAIERALRPQNLDPPAYTWLYAICRGLGNAAPDLVEYLAHKRLIDMENIIAALKAHELCNEEIGNMARKYGNAACSRSRPPAGQARCLWKAGALDIGCQGDPLLHPAALVACGLKYRLANLVVAGQMQVYLPMAQRVFHWLMKRMREKFGPDWSDRCPEKPDGIGKLARILSNFFRTRAEEEATLANYWKDVRNNIAHAKLIPYKLALRAVNEYDRLSGKQKTE